MNVPGYAIGEALARQGTFIVYRGRRLVDRRAVLLETARPQASAREAEALQQEFDLLSRLTIAGLPRPLELVQGDGAACLVLEDRGLLPWPAARRAADGADLARVFPTARRLCGILAELHRRDITHGAIAPGSVWVDAAGSEVQLFHVGAGARSPIASSEADDRIAYLSPEQTGRINRAVDYRTDFYSLGATLYEMLVSAPPFVAGDPLEVMHAHIAKAPVPPAAIDARIPASLSRVVLKLLAKAPGDRYQSAPGIAHDLERCERQWLGAEPDAVFELGERDVSDRFVVSEKLYGREREVADLLRAFEETRSGRTRLMLVSGYSGIGKTSLIHELYKPIVRQRGYFIAGKFDQIVRNIPYGALTEALRSLIRQLLTESEGRLSEWRARLALALGSNGGVLAQVLPEIELILGRQPAPPVLDSTESRNRFGYVFQRFVASLAQADHPLVVFLDDLQWVDAATLDVLHGLLTGPDIGHLLIVGAYRDNEVDAGHLLTWAVDRMDASGAPIARLALGPLALPDLTRFLCDTFRRRPDDIAPLAALIQRKTDGNPFFVIQFLKTLEQEGFIAFDRERAGWTYRLDAIAAAGMTDNVVDLMTRKIRRLSPGAQRVLTLAACIGNRFDWNTFLTATRQSPHEAGAGLSEALDAGLIQVSGDGGGAAYAFLHDRVQQAAYGLIPEEQKKPVHLDVGRLLAAGFDPENPDERLFTIVTHLNTGSDLITDPLERLSLARLNLAAGRKAKDSAAYRAAVEHFQRGIALVTDAHWRSEYALVFALHLEAAECRYLAGDFATAEVSFQALLERAASALDQAQVHGLRVTVYENQSQWGNAVASGLDGLALFGVSFPDAPAARDAALDREVEATRQALGTRPIASLVDLPDMTDANVRMVMRILTVVWAPAYISGDQVLARLISATMVRLSLEHGLTEDSAYGFVTHAITIGPIRRDYRSAYEWGELALSVNRRFNDLKRRAKIHQQFQAHVNLWSRPFETCITHAREACRIGLETGDFTYAGYGAASESWPAFLVSRHLDQFVRDYTPSIALLGKIRMTDFGGAQRIMLNWALALQGRTSDPLSLSDDAFDEEAFAATYETAAPFFLTFLYTARLHLAVLHGRFALGLDAARRARSVAVTGTIWPVLLDVWGALAAAGRWEEAGEAERRELWTTIERARGSLDDLSASCPENFRVWALVVAAEMARLRSSPDEAASLYVEAIAVARHSRNLQQEALANEWCGRLWLARGKDALAAAFLAEAHRAYEAWGASAKTAELQARYGEILAPLCPAPPAHAPGPAAAAAPEAPASVDMATVLKVARAVAVEIEVGGLLRKLLKLALENAGAHHGSFLQERDGALVVEAEAIADPEEVRIGLSIPLEEAQGLCPSVVRYVRRTDQSVVVGDAALDERFAADAGRAGSKSILCVPVGHQGRLGGILYLENNLTADAFTPERIEVMRILAAQTAISLENARLYEEMKSEVARRTVAERALRDALAQVESLKNRLEAENVYLQEEIRTEHNFNEIVGGSPALLETLRRVERVAPTESSVLITGETGSGKELIARAIHSRSRRGERPLVKVNCGAIPPGLVESELFGHVKGAFTGALDKRVGRFELANGGTIFLDEVGELPLDAQVKLLRVLQEQEFEPVGSSKTVRISVRVIAATNRDLERAAREEKFRVDLLYRLNVFPIHVPPLRERRSDIPLLVGFLISNLSRRLGKPIQGFSARSMERMKAYDWPGNIRELQNVVERAAILTQGPVLELEGTVLGSEAPGPTVATAFAHADEPAIPERPDRLPGGRLEDVERLHILSVLGSTNGLVEGPGGAATILGLHPNTLRSRMKKLGISRHSRLQST